ncbi:hypothetical protein MMC34_000136 [Xylographa carneopallida]|nr:hypothetical protein [Xylographa carneopallida]
MLAMSTTSPVFASPLAQLTPDPLGAFVQSTISSAEQQAQAHPGPNSQISVCTNGVCTQNPSAPSGPTPPGANNAASGINGGSSSLIVNSANGQTVQGPSQVAAPVPATNNGAPDPKPKKETKKPGAKSPGAKKAPPRRRRRQPGLLLGIPDPVTVAATVAKGNRAAIDHAVVANPGISSASIAFTNANGQVVTGPAQGAPPASDPTTKKQQQQQRPSAHKQNLPPSTPALQAIPKPNLPLRPRFLDGATTAAQALAIADRLAGDDPAPAPVTGPAGSPSTDSSTVVNADGQDVQGPEQVAPGAGAGGNTAAGDPKKKKKGKGKGKKGGGGVPKGKGKGKGKMPMHVRRAVEGWLREMGY